MAARNTYGLDFGDYVRRSIQKLICVVFAAAIVGAAMPTYAAASLRSEAQLNFALRASLPCCVVDGRSEAQRAARPLAEALPYRDGLKITPTASVIVVADTDARALAIAESLAKTHSESPIFAVQGGIAAWEAVQAAIAADPPGRHGLNFVIPSNTCEQGPPLQQLRGGAQ